MLQAVTGLGLGLGGYKGFQWVARGYRGLQGLHSVRRGYRG